MNKIFLILGVLLLVIGLCLVLAIDGEPSGYFAGIPLYFGFGYSGVFGFFFLFVSLIFLILGIILKN